MSSSEPPSTPSSRVNLGWALAALLRAYQKQVETALADLPGGSRAFLVMSLVARETCQSQVAIAERLGLDKTTLTYLLDGLEKQTLIARSTDPDDRRTRHINLTSQGAERLGELAKAVEQVELEVLSRLPVADAEHFHASLVKAAGLLTDSPNAPDPADTTHICQTALTGNT